MVKSSTLFTFLLTIGFVLSSSSTPSPVIDLFVDVFRRTLTTPMVPEGTKNSPFTLKTILNSDVFTLDDGLRLFIQQFMIALFNGHIDHLPQEWEKNYPHYDRILTEINNVLDLIEKRTLTQISMKDILSFTESKYLIILSKSN